MRIGIDARPLSDPRIAGVHNYLKQILLRLTKNHPEHEYILYSHRPVAADLPFRAAVSGGWMPGTAWIQLVVPRLLERDRIDLFWGPWQTVPLATATRVARAVTIHDVAHLRYAYTMRPAVAAGLRYLLPRSAERADVIIADSASTLGDLRRIVTVGDGRATVVPLGVTARATSPDDVKLTVAKHGIRAPYILTVGTLEARKNVGTALRAFAVLRGRFGWTGSLAVVGGRGWRFSPPADPGVHWLGFVSDEDLSRLYAGAEAFVFPSLYEGFGLPPLEAMAAGTPVVCSDIPVLRETLGDAALYVSPHDAQGAAAALASIVQSPERRKSLSQACAERARAFTWDRTAEATLQALCEGRRRRARAP